MRNHSDFYRLLHVQDDAPVAVIKASYRAMMQKLRYHPDLGGEAGDATLLNEAMRTLGDPAARATYDRTRRLIASGDEGTSDQRGGEGQVGEGRGGSGRNDRHGGRHGGSHGDERGGGHGTPVSSERARGERTPTSMRRPDTPDFGIAQCRFCHASRLTTWTPETGYETRPECTRCGGPTRPVERVVANTTERPRATSHARGGNAILWPSWPLEEPIRTKLIDLSITGCAFESTVKLAPGQVVLLHTEALEAIAEVRTCQPSVHEGRYRTKLAFLTVRTLEPPER